MQVVLMDKVVNLGSLGDVVKVRPGYARNYLIPKGMAKRATPENLAFFEAKRAELEAAAAAKLDGARSAAEALEGLMVQITRKSGLDDRLFGSVSSADVVEALAAMGHTVERTSVRMPDGPIKEIGDKQVQIALHTDVIVTITVSVLGEH